MEWDDPPTCIPLDGIRLLSILFATDHWMQTMATSTDLTPKNGGHNCFGNHHQNIPTIFVIRRTILQPNLLIYIMVSWFGLVVWIFEIPVRKGLLLRGIPRIPNHRAPNHQFTTSWFIQIHFHPFIIAPSQDASDHQASICPLLEWVLATPPNPSLHKQIPKTPPKKVERLGWNLKKMLVFNFGILQISRAEPPIFTGSVPCGCWTKNRGTFPQNGWWK